MSEPYTKIVPWRYGQFLGLIHDPDQFGLIAATGEYCESEVDVFRRFVREDSTVLDCGASMGAHTVALAKLCPAGRVYAFEPQRIPFQVMCGNVQLNHCANVSALPYALGHQLTTVRMKPLSVYQSEKWGMNTISDDGEVVSMGYLDAGPSGPRGETPPIDFIKIDVEGWELQVLLGGRKTIRQDRPVIYLEYNWHQAELRQLLKNYGYAMWTHEAPAAREPNFNGVGIPRCAGTPMLLALPNVSRLENERFESRDFSDWQTKNGFSYVPGIPGIGNV